MLTPLVCGLPKVPHDKYMLYVQYFGDTFAQGVANARQLSHEHLGGCEEDAIMHTGSLSC